MKKTMNKETKNHKDFCPICLKTGNIEIIEEVPELNRAWYKGLVVERIHHCKDCDEYWWNSDDMHYNYANYRKYKEQVT